MFRILLTIPLILMFFSQAEASFNIESEKNILLDYYSYSELNEKIDT